MRQLLFALLLGLLLLGSGGASASANEVGAGPGRGLGEGLPVCIFIPPLRYPPALAAEGRHLGGSVLVSVDVDAKGHVERAKPLRSDLPELFIVEALRAARQSRFLAARRAGRGERGSVVLLLRFPGPAARAPGPEAAGEAGAVMPPDVAEPAEGSAAPAAEAVAPPASAGREPGTGARGALHILDAGFGRGVENRRLKGRGDVFAEGDRVFFWMEVEGAVPGQVLRHVWIFRGHEMQEIPLTLKAERWASWSYKTFFPGQTGTWLLELRDAEDDLLGSWTCYCE